MTDEMIIKALECCNCREWCADCPLKDNDYCKDVFSHQAVDLINRQKAEIERLKVELKAMRGAANLYKMAYEKAPHEIQVEMSDRKYMQTSLESTL